jgi:hypothetical protein
MTATVFEECSARSGNRVQHPNRSRDSQRREKPEKTGVFDVLSERLAVRRGVEYCYEERLSWGAGRVGSE